MSQFVIGGEAGITFRPPRWSGESKLLTVPMDDDDGFFARNRIGITATLGGRFGYAWNMSMLYVLGGATLGQIGTQIRPDGGSDQDLPTVVYERSSVRLGWMAGFGLEHAFNTHWFGRAELRYSMFQRQLFNIDDPALSPDYGPNQNKNSVSLTEGLVALGYRF